MALSNEGKFIDRAPYICAAGKLFRKPEESVENTLQEFPVDDKIQALKHDAKIWQKEDFVNPLKMPNYLNREFLGLKTEIQPILKPGVKSRFQTFLHDLKETFYHSYWLKEIGKTRDQVPYLPKGMNIYTTTFGKPYKREITVKDLVSPPKTVYEVQYDSQVGHEWYRKSHNDFNPGEQLSRNYSLPFSPEKRYGSTSHYDPRGLGMQTLSHWFINEPITYCNKNRADFIKRHRPQVGKPLAPNENIKYVPKGYSFGNQTKMDRYTVEDLLKDPGIEKCEFKKEYLMWFQSLMRTRDQIEHLKTVSGLDMDELLQNLIYEDTDKKGYLPIELILYKCKTKRIKFNIEYILKLCLLYNIINGESMDYKKFHSMINPTEPLVDVPKFEDIPEKHNYFLTSYQAACCDHIFIDNSAKSVAGLPSIRHDQTVPKKLDGQCQADIDHLGSDTTAKAVLSPNIFTHYGLTYRDFFKPRTAEVLRTLFTKVGYTFTDDTFDTLWKMGLEVDKSGLVCVDTFKNLLEKHYPKPKLQIDDQQC